MSQNIEIKLNSPFLFQKIDGTSIGFDLIAICGFFFSKKKKDIGILVVFKPNKRQQHYSYPKS